MGDWLVDGFFGSSNLFFYLYNCSDWNFDDSWI